VIEAIQSLIGTIGVGIRTIQIKKHYLEGTNLILVLEDNSKISIDISEYIEVNGELTVAKIEELIVSYFENKTIEEVEK
jgi:hypothetical protein